MTNREKLRQMTDEELGKALCSITPMCGQCVARDYCYNGHNGYIDWLKAEKAEAEENE